MFPLQSNKGSCRPCRESNAECDKKRPRCGECVATNKPCGGYDLGNIFININSAGPPPVWSRSQNAQKYLLLDWASQAGAAQVAGSDFSLPESASGMPATSRTVTPQATSLCAGVDLNDIHGTVELFLDLFYRRFGPDKVSTDSLKPGSGSGGWRSLLPQLLGLSPILDTSIKALAASFIATQYQDQSLLDQARNMYLNALQMVQRVLPEPNSAEREDLLATALVMSSTEQFLSNGGGASWLAHVEGATRLLHCAFGSGKFQELHVYAFIQGLFHAITTRCHYGFSTPSYRPQVRLLFSTPRTYGNDLYFQYCEAILPLPNILNSADKVTVAAHSTTPTRTTAILAILEDLAALEAVLASWYESLKANMPGPWTVTAAQPSIDGVPFPLYFMSIDICRLYCLYWTSQLLVLEARHNLVSHLPSSQMPQQPQPGQSMQLSEYASLICRSVQFCTHKTSFAAAENIFLPLFIAASYYKRQGDVNRTKWCVNAFARISQDHKISFSTERVDLVGGTVDSPTAIMLGGDWDETD